MDRTRSQPLPSALPPRGHDLHRLDVHQPGHGRGTHEHPGEGIRRRAALFEPGPVPLLKQWVPIWTNSRLVGEAAAARDECLLRVHILPCFGNTRMSAIDMLAAQLFAKQLRRRLARSSGITILALLRTVLRDAVGQRLLLVDPLAHVEVPAEAAAERPVMTQDQVWALACRMPTQRLKTMIVTAAGTGMRFGELAALAPAAISLDTYRLHIDPDVGTLHEVAGKRWLGPPKPPSGARNIYLPSYLVEGLQPVANGTRAEPMFRAAGGGLLWRTTFAARVGVSPATAIPQELQARRDQSQPDYLRSGYLIWMEEDDMVERQDR